MVINGMGAPTLDGSKVRGWSGQRPPDRMALKTLPVPMALDPADDQCTQGTASQKWAGI